MTDLGQQARSIWLSWMQLTSRATTCIYTYMSSSKAITADLDPMTVANCTCFNMRKATRTVTQLYDKALRPSGLRATQFSLLSVVQNKGPLGITELAKALVTDRTTLSRNLKPLMARGLLEVVDGADRRERPIAITSKGRETWSEALLLWRDVQLRITGNLGQDRWSGLLGDLKETSDRFQVT